MEQKLSAYSADGEAADDDRKLDIWTVNPAITATVSWTQWFKTLKIGNNKEHRPLSRIQQL